MISEVNRILYASDLGEDARPVFRTAIRLCLCGNAQSTITFLNVVEPMSKNTSSVLSNLMSREELDKLHTEGIEALKQKVTQRVKNFLQEEVEEDDRLSAEQVNSRIAEGQAWETILEVADEIDASLIVMGTRHSDIFGHLLYGSTATKVMHKSKRPVLIAPI